MPSLRIYAFLFPIFLAMSTVGLALAQDFPSKPIRIVTSPVGGGGDFVARILVQELTPILGQPMVIDNRPSVIFSGTTVANASPDGHTLILTASNLWLQPFLRDNVPFDPIRDFAPITLATVTPNLVVVHPSIPANSIKELIAVAKAKPGTLNYGSGNTASSSHLSAELLKAMAGVDIVRVAYKGTGPAMNALVAGEVQLTFTNASATMGMVKAGKLRALAVTSAEPSPLFPGIPPVAAGLPGYRFDVTFSFLTTGRTPAAIVNKLNQAIVRALKQPEAEKKLFSGGHEIVGSSPEQLAASIRSDMKILGKLIKDNNIRE